MPPVFSHRPRRTLGLSCRLRLEPLEDLLLLSAYVVTTADDAGPGSLRQALLDANADPGPNTITFQIDPGGPQLISLQTPLPDSTTPVVIDGTTQAGFAGCPLIELDGANLGRGANGLVLRAGHSTVRGLVIHSFQGDALLLATNGYDTVAGNYLGTDLSGTQALSNGAGVEISMGTGGLGFNLIGGTAAGDGNLISGNHTGINLETYITTDNRIEGNLIGTDVTGTVALGNATGVWYGGQGDYGDQLGGPDPGAGNVISGNDIGVSLGDCPMTVAGNLIGTDITGTQALGNGVGVKVQSAWPGIRITGNVISANTGAGVWLNYSYNPGEGGNDMITGNYIGTDITSAYPLGNGGDGVDIAGTNAVRFGDQVVGNLIAYNGGRGVTVDTVWGEQIRWNSIGGNAGGGIALDHGGNQNLPFPDISSATSDGQSTTITGTLTSAANANFILEFFANGDCDPSGYGQGEVMVGTVQIRTAADGTADFTATLDGGTDLGQFITATATSAQANTSAFSACVAVTAPDGARLQAPAGERITPAAWLAAGEPEPRLINSGPVGETAVNARVASPDHLKGVLPATTAAPALAPPGVRHRGMTTPARHAGVNLLVLDEVLRELA